MNKEQRSLDQSLETYSATAKSTRKMNKGKLLAFGAAAAGGLLASSQAEADIVYSGLLNTSVAFGSTVPIDLDGNSITDFYASHPDPYTQGTGFGFFFGATNTSLGGNGLGGLGVQTGGTTNGYFFANKGAASTGSFAVGSAAQTYGWMGWATATNGGTYNTDPWGVLANPSSTQTGIVGVSFSGVTQGGGNGPMAGWIRFALHTQSTPGGPSSMTIVDFAYQDDGSAIHLGEGIPEPATAGIMAMATLALGAAGLRRRRKPIQKAENV